jgi:hypothetical protein
LIPTTVRFTPFAVGAANDRHSAYVLRFATIAYPWHPLFGRSLRVSPHRRGKHLKCIYTEERPGLSRELPNWMFDESYCSGMVLGPAEINIEGLNELAAVLAAIGKTRKRGARSRPSTTKEAGGAQKPIPKSKPVRSSAGTTQSEPADGAKHRRAARGPGRSSARGGGNTKIDNQGRRG